MIDLHCHCLPDLDDGSRSLEETERLLKMVWEDGCTAVVATPHFNHPLWPEIDQTVIAEKFRQMSQLQSPVKVLPGAEIRIDEAIYEVLLNREWEVPRLGSSRAVLIEFDHSGWYLSLDPASLMHELAMSEWRPILAHPEHYGWLCRDSVLLEDLVEAGAVLQVTAGSLTGLFGKKTARTAWNLVERGWVDVIASDFHQPEFRPPGLSSARDLVQQRLGDVVAHRLTHTNPLALLDGQEVAMAVRGT